MPKVLVVFVLVLALALGTSANSNFTTNTSSLSTTITLTISGSHTVTPTITNNASDDSTPAPTTGSTGGTGGTTAAPATPVPTTLAPTTVATTAPPGVTSAPGTTPAPPTTPTREKTVTKAQTMTDVPEVYRSPTLTMTNVVMNFTSNATNNTLIVVGQPKNFYPTEETVKVVVTGRKQDARYRLLDHPREDDGFNDLKGATITIPAPRESAMVILHVKIGTSNLYKKFRYMAAPINGKLTMNVSEASPIVDVINMTCYNWNNTNVSGTSQDEQYVIYEFLMGKKVISRSLNQSAMVSLPITGQKDVDISCVAILVFQGSILRGAKTDSTSLTVNKLDVSGSKGKEILGGLVKNLGQFNKDDAKDQTKRANFVSKLITTISAAGLVNKTNATSEIDDIGRGLRSLVAATKDNVTEEERTVYTQMARDVLQHVASVEGDAMDSVLGVLADSAVPPLSEDGAVAVLDSAVTINDLVTNATNSTNATSARNRRTAASARTDSLTAIHSAAAAYFATYPTATSLTGTTTSDQFSTTIKFEPYADIKAFLGNFRVNISLGNITNDGVAIDDTDSVGVVLVNFQNDVRSDVEGPFALSLFDAVGVSITNDTTYGNVTIHVDYTGSSVAQADPNIARQVVWYDKSVDPPVFRNCSVTGPANMTNGTDHLARWCGLRPPLPAEFALHAINMVPTTTFPTVPIMPPQAGDKSSTNGGRIAAIVLATIFGVAAIVGVAILVVRHRRGKREVAGTEEAGGPSNSPGIPMEEDRPNRFQMQQMHKQPA